MLNCPRRTIGWSSCPVIRSQRRICCSCFDSCRSNFLLNRRRKSNLGTIAKSRERSSPVVPTFGAASQGFQYLGVTHPPQLVKSGYDKGAQIEDAAHIQALVEHKRAARRHRGTDHLAKVAPESQTLLLHAAERGDNLGTITAALLRLLERYGAAELDAAIREAIARSVPHPNAVRLALDRRRELRNEAPPVAVILPEHVKARDAHVQPHRLEPYDQLKEQGDE